MTMWEVQNPFTGRIIESIEFDTADSVARKVADARRAHESWKTTPLSQRREVMEKFCDLLAENLEKCAAVQCAETGKPITQARNEIRATGPRVRFFMDRFEKRLKTIEAHSDDSVGLREEISWEPLGVIANISAWNYPFFVGTNVFVPALLVGNAVAYKPSEFALGTGRLMVELMVKAGLPSDLMPLILGDGATGSLLLAQDIDGVFFTGSAATGHKISAAVADKLIKVQLELGGKDPVYVCDDMDPKATAEAVGDGAFYNAGQSCCGVERIYVHNCLYEPFVDALTTFAQSLVVGDPSKEETYIGPLTRKAQIEILDSQVKDAVNKGAKLLCGGKTSPDCGGIYLPTVLSGVNHTMAIMKDESFGPVIGVQSVSDDDQAVSLMNDTTYGLTSSVYTHDEGRARRILGQMQSGTVYWNCCDRVSPHLPWSGRGESGLGLTLSEYGIETFAQPKAWHLKKG